MRKILKRNFKFYFIILLNLFLIITLGYFISQFFFLKQEINKLSTDKIDLGKLLKTSKNETSFLKNQDQYKINQRLQKEIKDIESSYGKAGSFYEKIQDLKAQKQNTDKLDKLYALVINNLSKQNFASSESLLKELDGQISATFQKLHSLSFNSNNSSVNIPISNTAPNSGHSRQQVKTELGTFAVDLVAADLNSTKIIVDTASDNDCKNDCPVLSLSDYAARSGAYAGVNGSYFCPATYPSCAGKTNSFDTLLMNKNKTYFNSDNNVYSVVPAVIFGSGWVRFVGRSLEWGRDTSVDGVIANQPLVLSGNNIVFSGDGDPKKGSKGNRSFVANKGNTVYIGVTYNATVAEVGYVLKSLGMDNGLNLDSGGSTALWFNGYKAGPGRNIPNAILFVRK